MSWKEVESFMNRRRWNCATLARRLRVSERRVCRWAARGRVPPIAACAIELWEYLEMMLGRN